MTVAPGEAAPLTHRQIMTVFAGLMLGTLVAALDQTIVSTALPTIVGELGGLAHYSWVVTAYLLTSTAGVPLFGKMSDLYGRRALFQAAIVFLLAGSVIAGVAQNMAELVAARAIQGIGGGGLMAMSLVIVGDIVPPRERGRYQGLVGSVFGVAAIAGPFIGGFFVDHLSWRWVFYINLPVGIVALVVTTSALHLPFTRRPHSVDYAGAGLLVAGVTALLVVLTTGGKDYAWDSPAIVGLALAGVVLVVLFTLQERRAAEPIIPLRLFRDRDVVVSSSIGFVSGAALLGGIVFMPLFLQAVIGMSATNSGLLLAPLMLGLLATAIASGRLITRTGRYKVFPIVGMAVGSAGVLLLSRLGASASRPSTFIAMAVLGCGTGMVTPVIVLAVQNAVDYRDLGTATSTVNFFRSLGSAFGAALFGAIFTARFRSQLVHLLPAGALGRVDIGGLARSPAQIHALPVAVQSAVVHAIASAVHLVFLAALPLVLAGFAITWLIHEVPLRDTIHTGGAALTDAADPVAPPVE